MQESNPDKVEAMMNDDGESCPFCRPDGILFENDLAYAKPDKFPVNPDHLHLIPRYLGDMDNPRGGVRGVIPSRQAY
jgi:diadenosine tetraphosphate (Ap4A) HIT family hydrolase